MVFGQLYNEMIKEIKRYKEHEGGLKLSELLNSEVVLDVWADKLENDISVKVDDVIGLCEDGKFIILGKIANEN